MLRAAHGDRRGIAVHGPKLHVVVQGHQQHNSTAATLEEPYSAFSDSNVSWSSTDAVVASSVLTHGVAGAAATAAIAESTGAAAYPAVAAAWMLAAGSEAVMNAPAFGSSENSPFLTAVGAGRVLGGESVMILLMSLTVPQRPGLLTAARA